VVVQIGDHTFLNGFAWILLDDEGERLCMSDNAFLDEDEAIEDFTEFCKIANIKNVKTEFVEHEN